MKAFRRVKRVVTVSVLLGIGLISGITSECRAQQIDLDGKETNWIRVGSVPKMTPFMIQAKGSVDFGGIGNDDGATAGVTGNAFVKFCTDNWSTIEKALEELAKLAVEAAKSDDSNPRWAWQKLMQGADAKYDEGGFWVTIMTEDRPPKNGTDPAEKAVRAAPPALFYWFNQLNSKGIAVAYDKDVYVYVRQHDGGKDPFKQGGDWGDNSGSYAINLFMITTPLDQLIKEAKADDAHPHGPLQMNPEFKPPTMFEANKTYILLNVQTNGLLHGNARGAGGDVGLSGDQDSHEQWWRTRRQKDKSYTLQNVGSSGFLKTTGNGLQESGTSNDASTGWKVVGNLDGTFTFVSMSNQKCLAGEPGNTVQLLPADGSAAQRWKVFAK